MTPEQAATVLQQADALLNDERYHRPKGKYTVHSESCPALDAFVAALGRLATAAPLSSEDSETLKRGWRTLSQTQVGPSNREQVRASVYEYFLTLALAPERTQGRGRG